MIVQTVVGNRAVSEAKSERGRRTIALDDETVAALAAHREAQAAERAGFGSVYHDDDLVFCREDGTAIWPRSLTRSFARQLQAAHLPKIRLHDLRHTHATLALQAGVHPKVVQERLGHASISITLDVYSHAIPAMQEEAAARIAHSISIKKSEPVGSRTNDESRKCNESEASQKGEAAGGESGRPRTYGDWK